MEGDPEKVESRGLSFSVTPDLKNGSRWMNILKIVPTLHVGMPQRTLRVRLWK
jgi:hypothetical protein